MILSIIYRYKYILTQVVTQKSSTKWFSSNNSVLNETKTQRFTTGFNNLVNNLVDIVKFLCIHLDFNLSWKRPTDSILIKSYRESDTN